MAVADAASLLARQIHAFPALARSWVVGTAVLVSCLSWNRPATALALGWAALALLRVPSRALLFEQVAIVSMAMALIRGPFVAFAMCVTLSCLLSVVVLSRRPEIATQRFVGFDLCHILLTSRGRPCTTHHFLDLASPLERRLLVQAVAWLSRDVERVRSFVREAPLGIERFVAPALWVSPESLVEWSDSVVDVTATDWFERGFDLATEPAVRVFHAPMRGGGYRCGMTLHHSLADGTGAMELLGGLLRRYDSLRGVRGEVPAIVSDGPRYRSLFWRFGFATTCRLLYGSLRTPRGLHSASLIVDSTPRPSSFAVRIVDLADASWAALSARAKERGLTPNQLLITASVRAADSVRRAAGLAGECFRVLLPTDLRTALRLPRSLPNYLGTVSVDVRPEEVLLESLPVLVRERIAEGRVLEAQLRYSVQIGLLGALFPPAFGRRALRLFDQDPRTLAFSYLFSHIRVPRELYLPEGATVERLWCASAQGRQPGFGIVLTTLRARTTVALQYLVPYVSHDTAESFERAFTREVERLASETQGGACESA